MKKINEERLAQLQKGEVVLYTGDKKGSEEVKSILNEIAYGFGDYSNEDFCGIEKLDGGDVAYNWLTISKLNNRPIHAVEWFYEVDWFEVEDQHPPEGTEVILFNEKWINEDFNPNGTRIGFLNGDFEYNSAYWSNYKDCYFSRDSGDDDPNFDLPLGSDQRPTHWRPIPTKPENN